MMIGYPRHRRPFGSACQGLHILSLSKTCRIGGLFRPEGVWGINSGRWGPVGGLFPLDGGGGFGGDVVDYAVYAADFVDDLVAGVGQELVGEMYPVGRHTVGGNHCP